MNKYLLTSLATIFMAGTALSQDDVATKKPVSPPPLSMVVDGDDGVAAPTDGSDDPIATPVGADSDDDAVAATATDGGDDLKPTPADADSHDDTAAIDVPDNNSGDIPADNDDGTADPADADDNGHGDDK